MASKNKVTLTFAGDSEKLEKAFDEVGASAKDMGRDVDSASSGFDKAGEAADNLDTKAMGFRDTMTGVQDSMLGVGQIAKGNLFEGFFTLGMGIGDLGSGLYNFLIPSLKSTLTWLKGTRVGTLATAAASRVARVATLAWAAAQRVLNMVLRMNPIGLVITALFAIGAALVLAWKKSETFRRIVTGTWNAIASGARWLWDRIRSIWGNITSFLGGAARRIGGFFSGMWNGITTGLKAALNGAIWLINRAIDGINWLISNANRLPGVSIPTIGHIPTLHTGGIVPGAPGSETMALLQAGERVSPAGQTPKTMVLQSDGSALSDLIVSTLRTAVRREGGNVQFVLGQG